MGNLQDALKQVCTVDEVEQSHKDHEIEQRLEILEKRLIDIMGEASSAHEDIKKLYSIINSK